MKKINTRPEKNISYDDLDHEDSIEFSRLPDTYKISKLLKPIGVGFGIFLFLLFVSCVPFMLEQAKTPAELKTAVILFCVFMLVLSFFVVVRMIKRI